MEILWSGQACFKIKGKTGSVTADTSGVTCNNLTFSGPGEYEASGIAISGIASGAGNTIYNIMVDGINIVHLGSLQDKLNEGKIGEIGQVDILLLPAGAVDVVPDLEPKIIIPMDESVLKSLGKEDVTAVPKLAITKEKLPEETEIIVLSKVWWPMYKNFHRKT